MTAPLLELWNLSKVFPGVVANDKVNLKLHSGEILALLGENGAGKSTLVKMIYGVNTPTSGAILWNNHEVTIASPTQAREMGIGMVFQHFSVFETLTVLENIELGLDKAFLATIDNLRQTIIDKSLQYQLHVDPDRYVHSLSIGERQRVEILRCLIQNVKLLILDEPTSVLAPQEIEGLFAVLNQLALEGCAILFISHKLKEVTALCHRAVILRGGKVTGECDPSQETPNSIARMMVGEHATLSEHYDKVQGSTPVLHTKGLSLEASHPFGCALKDVALRLNAGEIFGLAGVAGNGQEELLAALSGEDTRASKGSIQWQDEAIGHLDAGQRRKRGLAYVPANRLGQGAVPEMSLEENTLLTHAARLNHKSLIQFPKLKQLAKQLIQDNQVKCRNEQSQAKSLSGGNLQKFIMGREIAQSPTLLICAHPTWGVDIGAASAIHRQLIALRDQGAAVLVVSEDIDELFMICDRLAAIYEGHVSPAVKTDDTSIDQLGEWIAGGFLSPSSYQGASSESQGVSHG